MAKGVEEAGGSERHPVMGWIGRPQWPTRKGADFRLVPTITKAMNRREPLETLDNAGH